MTDLKHHAEQLAEFVRLGEKATPGPWACPGANVFRLFAWKDCGEEGMKPVRCIVPNSMADVHFGRHEVKWPQNEAASMEAYSNLRMIASSRSVPAALVALLRKADRIMEGDTDADEFRAAIRPIIEAAGQEDES